MESISVVQWEGNHCSPEENVLVLGANGFVGSTVVQNLLEKRHVAREHDGISVGTVYAGKRRKGTAAEAICQASGVVPIFADITDQVSLEAAIKKTAASVIYNLAGVYAWWRPRTDQYEKVNVEGVRKLCEAAKSAVKADPALTIAGPLRIVHVSTPLAFGRVQGQLEGEGKIVTKGLTPETAFSEEDTPGVTTSLYASSKQRGDLFFEDFFRHRVTTGDGLRGSICYLACCIGKDHKLLDPTQDVMRISDLVRGRVPATIASNTTFTYVCVKDSAEAIVRSGERLKALHACQRSRSESQKVDRILIGKERVSTKNFYQIIAELGGVAPPRFEVPAAVALGWAHATSIFRWFLAVVSFGYLKQPPQAAPDVVRTAISGTLLFRSDVSQKALGLKYRDIREAFKEAVELVKKI